MGIPKDCEVQIRSRFRKGSRNLITDVPGVKAGHVTLNDDAAGIHTGVTAILPHGGNLFREKVLAGVSVINGFGKSVGLVQIEELGTIESPILLTNTFGVGTALNAAVKYMLARNEDIGVFTGTVNCVVTECNDGELNDIRGMHVTEEDVLAAIEHASEDFEEGAVGGGTGMICMGLKGGIGSSSRILVCDGQDYTVGALVMSNFGMSGNLRIDGRPVAEEMYEERADQRKTEKTGNTGAAGRRGKQVEKGSVIIVLATDIPLNERQLRRVARRAVVGLARTGSYLGNGSGDIAIAFSTGNKVPHYSPVDILPVRMFHDSSIDKVFEAAAEAVEEAVVSSLYHGKAMDGIYGKHVDSLHKYILS